MTAISPEGNSHTSHIGPITLRPRLVERVWGGDRFKAEKHPIGEVWLVHESNLITSGAMQGSTLSEAVKAIGNALLGTSLWAAGERSFPLLVKLIDAREWLSIQVHPNDALAAELEGPGHRGKSEAWYALAAGADAEIIAGVRPWVDQQELVRSIEEGSIEGIVKRFKFGTDHVIELPAGTIHALGPETFIYEIQQSSDTTYRIYDWDRPEEEKRDLQISQSVIAANASFRPRPKEFPRTTEDRLITVVDLPQFILQRADISQRPLRSDTRGEVFHLLTLISGAVSLQCGDVHQRLSLYDTILIPAGAPPYAITSSEPSALLVAIPRAS